MKSKSKNRFFTILCMLTLLLIILAGCNSNPEPEPTPEPTPEDDRTWHERYEEEGMTSEVFDQMMEEQTAGMIEEMKQKEIIPDYDQTGELVIWTPPGFRGTLIMSAVTLFEQMYPNVNVILQRRFGDGGSLDIMAQLDAYYTQLTAELLAGKGPDVLFLHDMPPNIDLHKMADNGAFLDLNEFIEQDEDFNLDDYVKGVIDSGHFRGNRYVMPYGFWFSVYVASQTRLNEIGFDTSQTGDMLSFINEIVRTQPKMQANPAFGIAVSTHGYVLSQVSSFSGVKLADFETNTVLPDEESFKKLVDAYKPYYHTDSNSSAVWRSIGGRVTPQHLIEGRVIFNDVRTTMNFFETASQLKTQGGFVMTAMTGIDGKNYAVSYTSIAIRAGSPNAQNAWNFIKLLLSAEIQGAEVLESEHHILLGAMPVYKNAIIARAERWHNYYEDGVTQSYGLWAIDICTKLSDAEKQAYIDLIMSIGDCYTYRSAPIKDMFDTHMTPFFKDEVGYETAISALRNQLRLYVSE
jgi:ABC-type glycerol-3-phosphate transport system substrate-binding protein